MKLARKIQNDSDKKKQILLPSCASDRSIYKHVSGVMKTMFFGMKTFIVKLVLIFLSLKSIKGDDFISGPLFLDYYRETCPLAEEIIAREVEIAVLRDPRMAASLLRLHFHDCFVQGCDASVLLDNFGAIVSEKLAVPNVNSLRGFEVIDRIKYLLEEACPCTVSCADILATAARDSVSLRGGPRWDVWLGRKDSLTASFAGANTFIPAPNFTLEALIASFQIQGLDIGDLVALSGSHTMGKARCTSFRQRVYQPSIQEQHDEYRKYRNFRRILRSICPNSGRDNQLAPLDYSTPVRFDNHYYINLLEGNGLLGSDNALVWEDEEGEIIEKVWAYATNQDYFFKSFANSMVKMGNINVLTGVEGEIRRTCRFIN